MALFTRAQARRRRAILVPEVGRITPRRDDSWRCPKALVIASVVAGVLAGPANAEWQPPTTLSNEASFGGITAAVNATGTAVAGTWGAYPAQKTSTFSGGSWSPSTAFSTDGDPDSPTVAIDGAGNATAVWYDAQRIKAAYQPAGGTWSSPQVISAASRNVTPYAPPKIAVDNAGDTLVAWVYNGPSGTSAGAAFRPAGGSWGMPQQIDIDTAVDQFPDVAIDANGNGLVVWQTETRLAQGMYTYSIQSRSVTSAGAWQPVQQVAPAATTNTNIPAPVVDFDAGNTAYVAWTTASGANDIVMTSVQAAGGSWSTPVPASSNTTSAFAPRISAGPNGRAALTWWSDNAQHVQAAATTNTGGVWSTPVTLDDSAQSSYAPIIAQNNVGDTIAMWTHGPYDTSQVQFAILAAGGTWSTPATLAPAGGNGALTGNSIALNVDNAGNAYAVWQGRDGTAKPIQASVNSHFASAPAFDTTPPKITVTTPAVGAHFTQGQTVAADFGCDDAGGSGVATCSAPSTVDTSSPGMKTFTVTATDVAGNPATKSVIYVVDPETPTPTPSPSPSAAPSPTPSPSASASPSPSLSPSASASPSPSPSTSPSPSPSPTGSPVTTPTGVQPPSVKCKQARKHFTAANSKLHRLKKRDAPTRAIRRAKRSAADAKRAESKACD